MGIMKKNIFVIITFFIFVCIVSVIINSNSNENKINSIILKSIEYQYSKKNMNLNEIYTKEFIGKISEDRTFHKEKLQPYKIVDIYTIEKDIKKGKYSIGVRISDKNGDYIQVMHISKVNNSFYIFNIEYDI